MAHFEVRGKLPPCAIHGMVDQRWRTARDQRRVQRRMLDNSGACICGSQIYMKRAKIQCMFKAPFLWATINSPSEVDLWRRRERCMLCRLCRCLTLELNCMSFPGSIMHKMCRYALHTETTLRSNNPSFVSEQRWPFIRAETLAIIKWSKEARSWTEMCTCCACISILCHQRG